MHQIAPTELPIGKTLKIERVTADVSLTDIAPVVGVSVGHLSRIESGERTASDELIAQIRAAVRAATRPRS